MKRTDSSTKNARQLTLELAPETDADRARAIVASLGTRENSDEVFEAFWQLDALPVNDVRDALTSCLGPLPDIDRLDPATRRAHGFPPPPLRLRTLSVVRDADILDLGPVAEAQLRIAGTTWDGLDLAPEDRLDGEIEGSLAGTVEHHILADASATDGARVFDVLLFAEDAGVVFATESTTVIALIAYRKVEMRDRRVRTAIEDALFAPAIVAAAESVAVMREKAVEATKATVNRVGAKIVAHKAISAKKTATKKAATKKASVKKPVAKKTATKKAAAKKASAKKPVAKRTTAAKKAAPKRAPKKKSARKRR